ncbi:MAG: hydrogenase maturation protease [Elusimicrobiota bacterium]
MQIKNIPFTENSVIMGIGNLSRGDDGIGVFISEKLAENNSIKVISCYEIPENYLVKVSNMNPDTVVFIDAVNMNKSPGSIEVLHAEEVSQGLGTHNTGLDVLAEFISGSCGAEIFVVAIQPGNICGNINPEVREAGIRVIEVIIKILGEKGL